MNIVFVNKLVTYRIIFKTFYFFVLHIRIENKFINDLEGENKVSTGLEHVQDRIQSIQPLQVINQ